VSGGGGSGLDAEGAADGYAAVADDAEFDETGTAELRRCPLGDPQEIAERVADDLDLSDDVVDGETAAYVIEEADDFPVSVICSQLEADSDDFLGLTLAVNELPRGDWDDVLEDAYDSYGADLTIED